MKYAHLLTEHVEREVAKRLPSKFAPVLHVWRSNTTHNLTVFATFLSAREEEYKQRLIALSLMGDETTLDTNEHLDFMP